MNKRSRLTYLRVSIFWSWIFTLLFGILVLITAAKYYAVKPDFMMDCITKFGAFILPQIGVMGVFFFQLQQQEQAAISVKDPALSLAAKLSVLYNVVFCLALTFGAGLRGFSEDLGVATDNVLKLMGVLGFLSTAPITYLFTSRVRPVDS